MLARIAELAREVMSKGNVIAAQVGGIGLGLPGRLNPAEFQITNKGE